MKTKIAFVLIVLLTVLSVTAYGKVKYVKTWKNPEGLSTTWKGKKVLAYAMTRLKDAQQGAEQAMVQELAKLGIQGIPAYTAIPPGAEKDRDMARRILTDAGIAGVLIMRVLDVRDETSVGGGQAYYLGPSYSTFYGFWGTPWSVQYIPPEIRTKTKLAVETLVYSVDQDKLLWAGTSETTNPEKVDKVIKDLADATAKEIKKAGLSGR